MTVGLRPASEPCCLTVAGRYALSPGEQLGLRGGQKPKALASRPTYCAEMPAIERQHIEDYIALCEDHDRSVGESNLEAGVTPDDDES